MFVLCMLFGVLSFSVNQLNRSWSIDFFLIDSRLGTIVQGHMTGRKDLLVSKLREL